MRRLLSRLTEDFLLLALLLLLPLLLWLQPTAPSDVVVLVDWHTVAALAGLMLLSRALEDSGYLARFAAWLLALCHNERLLAQLLLLFAALLSAVVTNDVALFILLPITLSIGRLTGMPVGRLIIFLALAVNAGSSLTPVGNPQNLLLWQASGYSFWQFTLMMAPLALSLLLLILLLSGVAFGSHKFSIAVPHNNNSDNGRLFGIGRQLSAVYSGDGISAGALCRAWLAGSIFMPEAQRGKGHRLVIAAGISADVY